MVLLGLGILLVSLSVLVYNYRFSSPRGVVPTFTVVEHDAEKSKDGSPSLSIEGRSRGTKSSDGCNGELGGKFLSDGTERERTTVAKPPTGQELENQSMTQLVPSLIISSTTSNDAPAPLSPCLTPAPPRPIPAFLGAETPTNAKASARHELPKLAKVSTMSPTLPPASNAAPQSQAPPFMSPPPRPTPTSPLRALPKTSSTLRPPPSASSTLRAPPSRSLAPARSSLSPSTSTLSPSKRPSKKVLLEPGHSPLDWAALIAHPPSATFLRGVDVPPSLIKVPPSLLRYHTGRKGKDAWGVWQGKVYNLSPYMKFHPGGVEQLMRAAGKEKEGDNLFNEIHPWVSWDNMLGECLVGILVSENEGQVASGEEALEEMD